MSFSLTVCSHCLQKIAASQEVRLHRGEVCFFLPVMDSYQRAFFALVQMEAALWKEIITMRERRPVDLAPCVEILHVEEGWWPGEEKRREIQEFYAPATHVVRHNVQAAA